MSQEIKASEGKNLSAMSLESKPQERGLSEEARPKTIHLRKFMKGEMTPSEAHRKLAWGGQRCLCGQPAVIRVRIFSEAAEVSERSPQFLLQLAAENDGAVPVVDFKTGKYVRISETFGCRSCRAALEKEAAGAPSWCVVEIDRGVQDTVQVAVP